MDFYFNKLICYLNLNLLKSISDDAHDINFNFFLWDLNSNAETINLKNNYF